MTVLTGKICLVTGGTRGLGLGIAKQLGGAGATVYVTGRTLKKKTGNIPGSLEETAKEIEARGGRCVPVVCDHSKDDDIQALFSRISKDEGRLDILVNNAYSAVNCTTQAAKLMVPRRHGLIVNISSPAGLRYLFNVPYGIGKEASPIVFWRNPQGSKYFDSTSRFVLAGWSPRSKPCSVLTSLRAYIERPMKSNPPVT
ncbi:hypothetical protein LSH36_817g00023 [Paralvinella palmiformis]|uniref:Uncharacterized protein n=1 Tax=Paralvinella palmiformis TaxID=53620 RepID=A0AAD9IZZ6_9ANNE|nr:hypothetical protein LSH36_817g00023 [Paralvinella palmiformis]